MLPLALLFPAMDRYFCRFVPAQSFRASGVETATQLHGWKRGDKNKGPMRMMRTEQSTDDGDGEGATTVV